MDKEPLIDRIVTKREAVMAKIKNLGDLVCGPMFHLSIAPALAEKHYGPFCTIGNFCGRTGCAKNDLPTSRCGLRKIKTSN